MHESDMKIFTITPNNCGDSTTTMTAPEIKPQTAQTLIAQTQQNSNPGMQQQLQQQKNTVSKFKYSNNSGTKSLQTRQKYNNNNSNNHNNNSNLYTTTSSGGVGGGSSVVAGGLSDSSTQSGASNKYGKRQQQQQQHHQQNAQQMNSGSNNPMQQRKRSFNVQQQNQQQQQPQSQSQTPRKNISNNSNSNGTKSLTSNNPNNSENNSKIKIADTIFENKNNNNSNSNKVTGKNNNYVRDRHCSPALGSLDVVSPAATAAAAVKLSGLKEQELNNNNSNNNKGNPQQTPKCLTNHSEVSNSSSNSATKLAATATSTTTTKVYSSTYIGAHHQKTPTRVSSESSICSGSNSTSSSTSTSSTTSHNSNSNNKLQRSFGSSKKKTHNWHRGYPVSSPRQTLGQRSPKPTTTVQDQDLICNNDKLTSSPTTVTTAPTGSVLQTSNDTTTTKMSVSLLMANKNNAMCDIEKRLAESEMSSISTIAAQRSRSGTLSGYSDSNAYQSSYSGYLNEERRWSMPHSSSSGASGSSNNKNGCGFEQNHNFQQQQQQQQQQHHHYPQPQQLTIASFMQKELLAGKGIQQSNNNNSNNGGHMPFSGGQLQQQQQQQQRYNTGGGYHQQQHTYQGYRFNSRHSSYAQQNLGFQQQHATGNQQQQNHQQQQQNYAKRNKHGCGGGNGGAKKSNSNFISTLASSASATSLSSATSASTTGSNGNAQMTQRRHQQQKQLQQSNSFETVPSTHNINALHRTTGYRGGYSHHYYQHHQNHFNGGGVGAGGGHHGTSPLHYSGASTPTTPQHQNFYNLTYVNMDPLNIQINSTAVEAPNSSAASIRSSSSSSTSSSSFTANSSTSMSAVTASENVSSKSPNNSVSSRATLTPTPSPLPSPNISATATGSAAVITSQPYSSIGAYTNANPQSSSSKVIPTIQFNSPVPQVPPTNIISCAQLDEAITSAAAANTEPVVPLISTVSSVTAAASTAQINIKHATANNSSSQSQNVPNRQLSLMPFSQQQQPQQSYSAQPLSPQGEVQTAAQPTSSGMHQPLPANQNPQIFFGITDCWNHTPSSSPCFPQTPGGFLLPPNSPLLNEQFLCSRRSSTSSVSNCSDTCDLLSSRWQNNCSRSISCLQPQNSLGTSYFKLPPQEVAAASSSALLSPTMHMVAAPTFTLRHPVPCVSAHQVPYAGRCCPSSSACATLGSIPAFEFLSPADRFLARAKNVEARELPPDLLQQCKYDRLSEDIWMRFNATQQTEQTFRIKVRLWRFIYLIIKKAYPRYGLYLVGSTMTGFSMNGSDIDMCLVAKRISADHRQESLNILKSLKDCLRDTGEFYRFKLIEARVPILRFKDGAHHIEVDLNYDNIVGIRNTHLLRLYAQLDWRVRPLALIVKLWARYHDINDAKKKTISSYSLVLMVIHYLQYGCKPHVLPCLHELYPEKFSEATEFGHLDLNEYIEPYDTENKQTLGEIFLGFLGYYSSFDFLNNAISVRIGGVISITDCVFAKATQNELSSWRELNIEEPFDLSNTARSVYDFETFQRVRNVFITSWQILEETLDLNSVFAPLTASQINNSNQRMIRANRSFYAALNMHSTTFRNNNSTFSNSSKNLS